MIEEEKDIEKTEEKKEEVVEQEIENLEEENILEEETSELIAEESLDMEENDLEKEDTIIEENTDILEEEKNISEKDVLEVIEEKEKKEDVIETKAESEIKVENKSDKKEETREENSQKDNFKPVVTKKNKKTLMIVLISIAILFLLTLFSTLFALANSVNTKILDGISIKDIDVSNLTKDEAKEKIEEIIKLELENNVILKYKDYETSIAPDQIEVSYSIDKAIDEAYSIGRAGNIITNNYAILGVMISKKDIKLEFKYSEEALQEIVEDIAKKIPGAVEEGTYSIEDDNLIITKGKPGVAIKEKELIASIEENIQKQTKDYVEIPTEHRDPKQINIDEIYSEVCTEPKDAYYESDPFKIYPHIVGVSLKMSLEEARQLLQEDKEEYIIALEYTMPEKTTNMIGTEAFPDLLSTFSTKYDVSNVNRTQNLTLAAGKIDGTILMPGDIFSYNKVVGKRTVEAGYKEAAMYESGRVVDGLGGGICQISSTLYNTALYANLEMVERSNHQFVTSYVGAGRDATVVYGAIDFQFKNTREYPVKIVCNVKNGIAEIQMYGVKQEVEYVVELETKITGSIPYTTKYEENPSLDIGVERVIQGGAPGYTSTTYKILKLNGVEVSRNVLSNDTYSAMQRIISKGTKGNKVVETTPTPSIVTTPKPTNTRDTNSKTNRNTY